MHPCHFLFHLNKPTDGSVLFRKLTQVTGSMISVWPLFRVLLNGFFFFFLKVFNRFLEGLLSKGLRFLKIRYLNHFFAIGNFFCSGRLFLYLLTPKRSTTRNRKIQNHTYGLATKKFVNTGSFIIILTSADCQNIIKTFLSS